MNTYPEIIKAAFPPHKAQLILQREQQQRGIVVIPAKVINPKPVQTIHPTQPPEPQPARVIVHHHTHQNATHTLTRTAGRAALLFALGFLGV